MNLKSILSTSKNVRFKGCFVVFRSTGPSYISSSLAREMGLKHGSFFDLKIDEDNDKDYYLSNAKEGLQIKCYLGNENTFQFHSRTTAHEIARVFGVDYKIIKVPVGPSLLVNGIEVWPLITSAIKSLNN